MSYGKPRIVLHRSGLAAIQGQDKFQQVYVDSTFRGDQNCYEYSATIFAYEADE